MSAREPRPGSVPLPGEWAQDGACRGHPTAWWYPGIIRRRDEVAPLDRATAIWAKGICVACPVRRPCLNHALRYHEAGIWGGTTVADRRGMKVGAA